MIAAFEGQEEQVEFLLNNGNNIHARGRLWNTPLHFAVLSWNENIINKLLDRL